jgi:hypothetical protein
MLEKLKSNYRITKKIKDDQFNVDLIFQYDLSMQISNEFFRLCIVDTEKNKCLLLEEYEFTSVFFPDQLINQLELIFDEHHLLQAGFWKSIKLSIKSKNFTLIPYSLFDEEQVKEYMTLACDVNSSEDILHFRQKSTDAVTIFSAERKITEWFCNAYPAKAIQVLHYTSPLLEGILMEAPNKNQRAIYLDIERNYFTAVVSNNRTIEFCNTFSFTSKEDFIYYVMYIFDQMKLNTETTPLVIWGELAPNSPQYSILYKYIRHVSFGKKPSTLRFSYHFDELFDHKFFDLYNIHFC